MAESALTIIAPNDRYGYHLPAAPLLSSTKTAIHSVSPAIAYRRPRPARFWDKRADGSWPRSAFQDQPIGQPFGVAARAPRCSHTQSANHPWPGLTSAPQNPIGQNSAPRACAAGLSLF